MWTFPQRPTTTALLALLYLSHGRLSSAFSQLTTPTAATPMEEAASSRRRFLQQALTAAPLLWLGSSASAAAADDDGDKLIEVYFGCGCFWHVQHEFVEAEKRILQRTDAELTARAGYAGGKALGDQGKVCYHNAGQIADYGNLGHAEIVRVQIPARVFPEFAVEYCNLFSKEGYRPDQFGDRGGEYRNVVGLPGGVQSKHAQQLVEASTANGDKLDFAKGKGDDPDRRALVFVMDTADFPFHVAEQYHQFHDGFNLNENYPASYNKLAGFLAKEGTLGKSDCPNGLIGIGALGL